jgi:hypothetical protein
MTETHLKFVNTLPCPISIISGFDNTFVIQPENSQIIALVNSTKHLSVTMTLNENCNINNSMGTIITNRKWDGDILLMPGSLQAVFIYAKNNSLVASISGVEEDFIKSKEGKAKLRIVVNGLRLTNGTEIQPGGIFRLKSTSGDATYDLSVIKESNDFSFSYTTTVEVLPGQ